MGGRKAKEFRRAWASAEKHHGKPWSMALYKLAKSAYNQASAPEKSGASFAALFDHLAPAAMRLAGIAAGREQAKKTHSPTRF